MLIIVLEKKILPDSMRDLGPPAGGSCEDRGVWDPPEEHRSKSVKIKKRLLRHVDMSHVNI